MNDACCCRKPLLELKDIHVAYVKKEILCGVSLSVRRGEILTLLGGNGSGKTTVLKTIAGLICPLKGSILFDRKDITHSSTNIRQQMGIGCLLQRGNVFPNLTVSENFEMGLRHRREPSHEGPQLGDLFGQLRDRRTACAGQLSGGLRQMLAIEMVLSQNPILALLDEPSSGLSSKLITEILDKVAEIATERHIAVLLVEQNVKEAIRCANRQLRLEWGTVRSQELIHK